MAEIHVLDQNTINQIAAGEVVERPASIVKELVENAVDARSTAITIEIKGGGIDFIRITDNGVGIAKDQIRKAFLPHATSKIDSAEDLITVQSLGFRGEALSSISAVSKVELITKTDEGISGVRYITEGGEELSYEEIGCPEGTTFIIRNLFFNTPARRKFLKSPMTEAGYVEAFVQRLALSHPDISFKFINENRNKIATSGNGNLKDVIYHIFGRDIALNLLDVDHEESGIHIHGFVGKPVISRGNRNYENYFVNGRYLKNNIIARGIEEGYKGHSMVHKFPFTALMIEMDSHYVDVNVHPAKMEMRFKNAEELYGAIVNGVSGSFVKKDLIPAVSLGKKKAGSNEGESGGEGKESGKGTGISGSDGKSGGRSGSRVSGPEPFEKKRREIEDHFASLSKDRIKEINRRKAEGIQLDKAGQEASAAAASDLIQKKIEALRLGQVRPGLEEEWDRLLQPDPGADLENRGGLPGRNQENETLLKLSSPELYGDVPQIKNDLMGGRTDEDQKAERRSLGGQPANEAAVNSSGTQMTNEAAVNSSGTQMSFADIPLLSEEARPRHRIIGQVFRTYWLVEYEEQLFFVDQHAAHEKVMYEKLKKDLDNKRIDQQMVAPPIVLTFSMREKNRYLMCQDAFAALGYQIEEFGEDAYCIRAVPANLYGIDQQDLFIELLDQIEENSGKLNLEVITDKLASMACKAAVKGNTTLSFQEMDALMDQLMQLENPYQCPHGRPTIISMSKYELEKKFKRIQ
ncbi:MAG: DNA mismatch repair endonuclease MutL [Eubacterium sp.]|nr:DNA mismatch repair endonuclease MutL [Eubacterium sp.]